MKADAAQRLIARCLVDPDYLETAGPALAAQAAPSNAETRGDLAERVRLFRGFITRIKHTQLRKAAPLTMRLLALRGADIIFFADGAPDYLRARRQGPLPLAELLARFERALAQSLIDLDSAAQTQIEAVLRHEARIWRTPRVAESSRPEAYPRLASGTAVEIYDFDVLAFCDALVLDPFNVPVQDDATHALFYRPAGSTTRIDEIDGLSAWVLGRLDGSTSVAALETALAQSFGQQVGNVVADIVADALDRGFAEDAVVAARA